MAYGQTKANGNADDFGALGRTCDMVSFSKTNITQAELNAVVSFVQMTNSIIAVSDFVAGTTDIVYMLIEGEPVAAESNFGGVTGVTSAIVTTFTAGH